MGLSDVIRTHEGALDPLGEKLAHLVRGLRNEGKATAKNLRDLRQGFLSEEFSAGGKEEISSSDYSEMIDVYRKNEELLSSYMPEGSVPAPTNRDSEEARRLRQKIAEEIYHAVVEYFRHVCDQALEVDGRRFFFVQFRPDAYEIVDVKEPENENIYRQDVEEYLE